MKYVKRYDIAELLLKLALNNNNQSMNEVDPEGNLDLPWDQSRKEIKQK
jgi:hypothetical protein